MGMTCGVCWKFQKQGRSSRSRFFLDMARTPLFARRRVCPILRLKSTQKFDRISRPPEKKRKGELSQYVAEVAGGGLAVTVAPRAQATSPATRKPRTSEVYSRLLDTPKVSI